MEAAERNAKSLKGTEQAVHKLGASRPAPSSRCYRCGRQNLEAKDYRFRDATCHFCKKKGHIAPACRSKASQKSTNRSERRSVQGKHQQRTQYVSANDEQPETSDAEELSVFAIGEQASRPLYTELLVDGKRLRMEIDTGAAVSIISESQQKALFPDTTVQTSSITLKTYTGEQMPVVGQMPVSVQYGEQTADLVLIVVAGDGPSLLGRSWLKHLRLDWKNIGKITTEKPTNLSQLLAKHAEIFTEEIGTIQPFTAKLHVRPDAVPKFCKSRFVPFSIKQAIEEELDKLEKAGILEKVTYSEWAAPIVAVPKKDGKIRICGDYKVTVNQALEVDIYPLPKPEDLFATLAGRKTFSTLDLSRAYQQLLLDDESAEYVTINTHRGLYRYTRLPFGIASAPAMFQKVMDTILQGIPNVICYIDDILVTGKDDKAHLNTLAQVFERLKKHGIRMKKEKCHFMRPSVEYLGHCIDADGLHATPEKLEAVVKAPEPTNAQELRSFIGLLNYYVKFLPNLSTTLHPLNSLLQQGRPWKWSSECKHAFQDAKDTLTSSHLLVHYDPALPLKMAADASAYGMGAVISHVMPDGAERPIAYASKTLSPSERNYAQLEKEALALIFGVKRFHQYLFGRKFTMVTDHKPLMAILGPKKAIPPLAAARLQRWALILAAYDYQLEFKPTEQHRNADGLSRLPLPKQTSQEYSSAASLFNINQIKALPISATTVQQATRKDPFVSKVLYYVKKGWPAQVPATLQPYFARKHELSVEADCLLWGAQIIIPKSLQENMLQELHRDHPGTSKMKSLARCHIW